MTYLDLLRRLGNLSQVIFHVVGVVGGLLGLLRLFLLLGSHGSGVVGQRLIVLLGLRGIVKAEGGLVAAAPVILVLTRTPAALELGLTLVLGHAVVEVPRLVAIVDYSVGGSLVALDVVAGALLVGQVFLALGVLGFLLLPGDQLVHEFLTRLTLFLGCHLGQSQQRVLQMDVSGIGSQFVQHVAALFQQLIIGICLRKLRHGLGVAGLSLHIVALQEVQVSQRQLRQGLVDAVAGGFLHG